MFILNLPTLNKKLFKFSNKYNFMNRYLINYEFQKYEHTHNIIQI
jgi:hypothetical protein